MNLRIKQENSFNIMSATNIEVRLQILDQHEANRGKRNPYMRLIEYLHRRYVDTSLNTQYFNGVNCM